MSFTCSDAGTGGAGGPLVPPPQYFADQLTLFEPGRTDFPHLHITTGPPNVFHLPAALNTYLVRLILDIENWVGKSDLGPFYGISIISIFTKEYVPMLNFVQTIIINFYTNIKKKLLKWNMYLTLMNIYM